VVSRQMEKRTTRSRVGTRVGVTGVPNSVRQRRGKRSISATQILRKKEKRAAKGDVFRKKLGIAGRQGGWNQVYGGRHKLTNFAEKGRRAREICYVLLPLTKGDHSELVYQKN